MNRRLKESDVSQSTNNLVVISDTHCGCKLGLCPPHGAKLDDGGRYMPSRFQIKVWSWWDEFWGEFVPEATKGEPYTVVFNGDALDGVHHNSTTQISHNLEDQAEIAYDILKPVVDRCEGRYYHIRGTEAHVGKSAREEESLAKRLNAIPNQEGQHARYELWKYVGDADRGEPILCHFLHHVGTTGSMAFESTAVMKELVEAYSESGRWGRREPDIIVRSHRHRNIEVNIPTRNERARAIVTPAWQGKTPFVWKIPGGRQSQPQFGGVVIRMSDDGVPYVRHWVKSLERPEPE